MKKIKHQTNTLGGTTMSVKDVTKEILYMSVNGLSTTVGDGISDELKKILNYDSILPKHTPSACLDYKNRYFEGTETAPIIIEAVSKAIDSAGVVLPIGTLLLHGGSWWGKDLKSVVTNRPLSTTIDPCVAFYFMTAKKNEERGRRDIMVMNVNECGIKAFPYNRRVRRSNEQEILLQSDIKLSIAKDSFIKTDLMEFHLTLIDVSLP
ncbi:hypothetical protein [uncultured Ruminobacter sp.]|uniref:hypothetical protein n=1 Tax=uncultured Ruminobacter sp. TaxID=538947 RepID=UPI0025D8AAD5|nr:hypothetical protein [uncultured Ruminobacter sp.]